MKHIKLLLSFLAFGFSFLACNGPEPEPEIQEKVIFRSASVEEGGVADTALTVITLNYNKVVVLADDACITLNGAKVVAKKNPKASMSVDVEVALEANTEYELVVPRATIFNRDNSLETAKELRLHFSTKERPAPVEDNETVAFLRQFGFGWNLGNHFDSFDENNAAANYKITWNPSCPYWDGVHPTQALYQNLAEMGVKTVRMPVTWGPYQDMTLLPDSSCNYTLDPAYVAEIRQNIDWAIEAGLIVLLNTHHDEYWQDVTSCATNAILNAKAEDRITKTWTQIAEAFKDYGDLLMFETFNELHDAAWGWGGLAYSRIYAMMDEWNQVAVDAIRATGGNNATRWIGVPGFCANPTFTNGEKHRIVIPNDPANHIMVAVHSYDPFDFCTQGAVQQWGHTASINNAGKEKDLEAMFQKMRTAFIDQGIPCYFGEFGVVARKNKADEPFRAYYLEYLCRCSYLYGIPVMLWDNNATSGETFHFVSHSDGRLFEEDLMRLMINAATSSDPAYTLQSVYNKAPK